MPTSAPDPADVANEFAEQKARLRQHAAVLIAANPAAKGSLEEIVRFAEGESDKILASLFPPEDK